MRNRDEIINLAASLTAHGQRALDGIISRAPQQWYGEFGPPPGYFDANTDPLYQKIQYAVDTIPAWKRIGLDYITTGPVVKNGKTMDMAVINGVLISSWNDWEAMGQNIDSTLGEYDGYGPTFIWDVSAPAQESGPNPSELGGTLADWNPAIAATPATANPKIESENPDVEEAISRLQEVIQEVQGAMDVYLPRYSSPEFDRMRVALEGWLYTAQRSIEAGRNLNVNNKASVKEWFALIQKQAKEAEQIVTDLTWDAPMNKLAAFIDWLKGKVTWTVEKAADPLKVTLGFATAIIAILAVGYVVLAVKK